MHPSEQQHCGNPNNTKFRKQLQAVTVRVVGVALLNWITKSASVEQIGSASSPENRTRLKVPDCCLPHSQSNRSINRGRLDSKLKELTILEYGTDTERKRQHKERPTGNHEIPAVTPQPLA